MTGWWQQFLMHIEKSGITSSKPSLPLCKTAENLNSCESRSFRWSRHFKRPLPFTELLEAILYRQESPTFLRKANNSSEEEMLSSRFWTVNIISHSDTTAFSIAILSDDKTDWFFKTFIQKAEINNKCPLTPFSTLSTAKSSSATPISIQGKSTLQTVTWVINGNKEC